MTISFMKETISNICTATRRPSIK